MLEVPAAKDPAQWDVLARFVARIDPEDAELLRQLVKDLGRARQ